MPDVRKLQAVRERSRGPGRPGAREGGREDWPVRFEEECQAHNVAAPNSPALRAGLRSVGRAPESDGECGRREGAAANAVIGRPGRGVRTGEAVRASAGRGLGTAQGTERCGSLVRVRGAFARGGSRRDGCAVAPSAAMAVRGQGDARPERRVEEAVLWL